MDAVHRVLAGKVYISPKVAEQLAEAVQKPGEEPLHAALSDREDQVLRLIAAGRTVHAIGKIYEIFNGRGITTWDHTTNNAAHTAALLRAVQENGSDLIFAKPL